MKRKLPLSDLVLIALFTALTVIMAYFTIPLPGGLPPITGQSLMVMLAGMILGPRRAALSQIAYLLLGVIGLPVFAGGRAGVGVLTGYSGGFIWGFVCGSYLIGKLTERIKQPSLLSLAKACFIGGVLVVYLPGLVQLSFVLEINLFQSAISMLPYLPGDLLKVFLAALLAQRIMPRIK
ncbi:MAG: biotin transporter BioY [Firmicutes bacterium]|nr:biotin transporter BioY [Bacillota bacterium]